MTHDELVKLVGKLSSDLQEAKKNQKLFEEAINICDARITRMFQDYVKPALEGIQRIEAKQKKRGGVIVFPELQEIADAKAKENNQATPGTLRPSGLLIP